jgi:hypothetical protein
MEKLLIIILLLLCSMAQAADIKKLNIAASLSQSIGQNSTTSTFSWALNFEADQPNKHFTDIFTLDSYYSKTGDSKVDRLLTGLRFVPPDYETSKRWMPMFLVQNEGTHSNSESNLLIALGLRKNYGYGFFELTAGASDDKQHLPTDGWWPDFGARLVYNRTFGRLSLQTGPEGQILSDTSARLVGRQFRYFIDWNMNYRLTDHIGLGFRAWEGTTIPGQTGARWFGITYTK